MLVLSKELALTFFYAPSHPSDPLGSEEARASAGCRMRPVFGKVRIDGGSLPPMYKERPKARRIPDV